jgi:hypothetical protein
MTPNPVTYLLHGGVKFNKKLCKSRNKYVTVTVPQVVLTRMCKTKKPAYLFRKRVFYSCAHLGSNQGPKDYESSTLTD